MPSAQASTSPMVAVLRAVLVPARPGLAAGPGLAAWLRSAAGAGLAARSRPMPMRSAPIGIANSA